jgi:hypothetical protein
MLKNIRLITVLLLVLCGSMLVSGCGLLFSNELIVNRYADALLTKNNELQFRFRINSRATII